MCECVSVRDVCMYALVQCVCVPSIPGLQFQGVRDGALRWHV